MATLKVTAGVALWGTIRELAFEAGVDIKETKIGFLTRGFTLEGDPSKLKAIQRVVEKLSKEDDN